MLILDRIIGIILPYRCIGCAEEGGLLCRTCAAQSRTVSSRCYNCAKITKDFRMCRSCAGSSRLRRVYSLYPYSGLQKDLIWRFKFGNAQGAAHLIVDQLFALVDPEIRYDFVGFAPTTRARKRARGYDQAELLASVLARRLHTKTVSLLARRGEERQMGHGRAERKRQMEDALEFTDKEDVRGCTILIIDDVLTTGATLEAAAAVLRAHGAAHVDAITYCQTIK